MGLLDFFNKEKSSERKLQKFEKKLKNMYVQAQERQYVIHELGQMATTDAVWVLLQRYNENNQNTTLDIEEKQLVLETLLQIARSSDADVVGQLKRFVMEKEVKVNWPMKALETLLGQEGYTAFVVEVLQTCDTIYQRTVEKKQELILRSTELKHPTLAHQLARFIRDDNETIRFLAFDAGLKQEGTPELGTAIFEQLLTEESTRIPQKVIPLLVGRTDLPVPEELRDQVQHWLPDQLNIHADGHVYRRRR